MHYDGSADFLTHVQYVIMQIGLDRPQELWGFRKIDADAHRRYVATASRSAPFFGEFAFARV